MVLSGYFPLTVCAIHTNNFNGVITMFKVGDVVQIRHHTEDEKKKLQLLLESTYDYNGR